MQHEQVSDRDEVLVITGALADMRADVRFIRRFFAEEDDEERRTLDPDAR